MRRWAACAWPPGRVSHGRVSRPADTPTLPSAFPSDSLDSPHSPESSPALLTMAQAADWLQVSPSTIRSYVREGRLCALPAFRIAGARSVRIPEPELRKILQPFEPTS